MNHFINLFARLAAILVIGGLAILACSSAGNRTNEKASAGTEKIDNPARNTRTSENKSSENQTSPETKQPVRIEVYDGRVAEEKEPQPTAAEEKLLGGEFARDEASILQKVKTSCDDDAPENISIVGNAEGSFTKPDAAQKAFLYERCRSGRSFGIGGIMIVEDEKVVAHYVYGENGLYLSISSLPDINQNGLSEIIFEGGGTGQGYTVGAIDIFEFKAGNLAFLGDAETYSDNGGAVENEQKALATAYKISVEPSANPIFWRETYEKKGTAENWSLDKRAEKFTLNKADAPTFIKIK